MSPELIQTWMYHSTLGSFVSMFLRIPNVWNIRHSNLSIKDSSISTILISRLLALMSYVFPERIVCCSNVAAEFHFRYGYCKKKFSIISNGYSSPSIKSIGSTQDISSAFTISKSDFKIGMVARYDPQKDHNTLFKALSIFSNDCNSFKLFLAGHNVTDENQSLKECLDQYNIGSQVVLLGQIKDVSSLMYSLDIHVLSSSFVKHFPMFWPNL